MTTPRPSPWDLARPLERRYGRIVLRVPGFYLRQGKKGPYLTLPSHQGFTVPIRDRWNRIVALEIRRDDFDATGKPREGSKYCYFTSKRPGVWNGPSAFECIHVPMGTNLDGDELRVTEGILKADLCSLLDRVPTIGMPSCGSWKLVTQFLEDFPKLRRLRVAMDGDFRTNLHVRESLVNLLTALQSPDREVIVETWDAQAKGIDDAFVQKLPINQRDVQEFLREISTGAENDRGSRPEAGAIAPPPVGPPGASQTLANGPNHADDDPDELARLFLDRHCNLRGVFELRFLRADWFTWNHSAWEERSDLFVKAETAKWSKVVQENSIAAE